MTPTTGDIELFVVLCVSVCSYVVEQVCFCNAEQVSFCYVEQVCFCNDEQVCFGCQLTSLIAEHGLVLPLSIYYLGSAIQAWKI